MSGAIDIRGEGAFIVVPTGTFGTLVWVTCVGTVSVVVCNYDCVVVGASVGL